MQCWSAAKQLVPVTANLPESGVIRKWQSLTSTYHQVSVLTPTLATFVQ